MTQQTMDRFKYKEKEFLIFGSSGRVSFHPSEWGLKLGMNTPTSCYRGWVGTYGLLDNKFCLKKISAIRNTYQPPHEPCVENHNQPAINGAPLIPSSPMRGFNCSYTDINLKLPFTGGMLLVAKRVEHRSFIGMFFWEFAEVHELIFQEGCLVNADDKTEIAAKIRNERLDACIHDMSPEGIAAQTWIKDSFQHDYSLFRSKI